MLNYVFYMSTPTLILPFYCSMLRYYSGNITFPVFWNKETCQSQLKCSKSMMWNNLSLKPSNCLKQSCSQPTDTYSMSDNYILILRDFNCRILHYYSIPLKNTHNTIKYSLFVFPNAFMWVFFCHNNEHEHILMCNFVYLSYILLMCSILQ